MVSCSVFINSVSIYNYCWCAFDYNTHKDFGSGDRICHHGVMDMFREPKFAAYAYASQADTDEGVVLKPVAESWASTALYSPTTPNTHDPICQS